MANVMVYQRTCNVLASSNILSISFCTSTAEFTLVRSSSGRLDGLFRNDLLACETSAVTLVMIILRIKNLFRREVFGLKIIFVLRAKFKGKESFFRAIFSSRQKNYF